MEKRNASDGGMEIVAALETWKDEVETRIARVGEDHERDEYAAVWAADAAVVDTTLREIVRALLGMYVPMGEADEDHAGDALASLVADATAVARAAGWTPRRQTLSSRLRTLVYRRDGYACVECAEDDITRLTIDHRVPVALGGGNDPGNLRTLCRDCNSRKGARL
jgi:hypothetical protein